jgi:3-methyladenine DNA glycosylase/8-oxoguanine DNA glycosylase
MKLQLINGDFNQRDAEAIISSMIQLKIKFHERKIEGEDITEEDMKMREKRIIDLQNNLKNFSELLKANPTTRLNVFAEIVVDE